MAGNGIVLLDEVVIPAPRARARQRRRPVDEDEAETIGADLPGPARADGASELDIPPASMRPEIQELARNVVPANPFAGATSSASRLPPAAQVLSDARQPGDLAPSPSTALAVRVPPPAPSEDEIEAQRQGVQALPVADDGDSEENAVEIIGASDRARGLPMPARPQLRTSNIDLGGGSLRQAQPFTPVPSVQLRAPEVMRGAAPADPGYELSEEDLEYIGRPRAPSAAPPQEEPDLESIGATRTPLKPQMTQPAADPEDERDRVQAQRISRAQRALAVISAIPALFGGRSGGTTGAGIARISMGMDPNAPLERIRARREARDTAAREAEQRDYERTIADRRMGLEERRIAQAEGATSQDVDRQAALYDPQHPAAASARLAYARLFRAVPQGARPQLASFAPSPDMRGMSALDVRQQAALLSQAWGRLQQENPNLFRVGRRSSGGRVPRGQLAGLGGGERRTVDYGVSEGLTPEDYAVLGVDPASLGIEFEEAPADDMAPPPVAAAATPSTPLDRVRARRAQRQGTGGGNPAPQPPTSRPAPAPNTPAPQGRPILDRDVTEEEYGQLDAASRTTVQAARAYIRQHPGTPWNVASANVNGMTDAHRSDLISQWGNPRVNPIPGFRLVQDTGRLTPQRMSDIREYARTANVATALSSEVLGLIDRISALNLAENQLAGNAQVQEALGKARRLQTLLRIVDRTGVPTGDEQQRAMQEAPEPITPMQLLRSRAAYEAMPRSILSVTYRNMQGEGFLPERPRPRAQPAQGGGR